jgi:hypothetical protein
MANHFIENELQYERQHSRTNENDDFGFESEDVNQTEEDSQPGVRLKLEFDISPKLIFNCLTKEHRDEAEEHRNPIETEKFYERQDQKSGSEGTSSSPQPFERPSLTRPKTASASRFADSSNRDDMYAFSLYNFLR